MSGIYNTKALGNDIINHCKTVTEVMLILSNGDVEMYTLGLVHDIGKLYDNEKHAELGSKIMQNTGYKYCDEIFYHGKYQKEYKSKALILLNIADLLVDSEGKMVKVEDRLLDIGVRYGFTSNQYVMAEKLAKILHTEIADAEKRLNL